MRHAQDAAQPEPLSADFTAADGTVDQAAYKAAHDVWFDQWTLPSYDDLAAQLRRPNLPVYRRRIVAKLATVPAIRVEISGETEKSRNEVEAEMAADGWPPPTPRFTAQQLSAPCQGQRIMTRARSSLGGSRRPAGRRTRSTSASSSSDSPPGDSDGPGERPRHDVLLGGRDRLHVAAGPAWTGVVR